jgi:hypothetical protein
MYNMANENDTHIIEFKGCNKFNSSASDAIEPPAFKLMVPRVIDSTWAEEMDREHGYTLQGEYIQDNYPPVPSPAPWYLWPTTHVPTTHVPPTQDVPSHFHITTHYLCFTCHTHNAHDTSLAKTEPVI